MIIRIFVNLPGKALDKSRASFKAIGFSFNPQFTDKTAANPYKSREARPPLVWRRKLPIGGEPADIIAIVAAYGEWLSKSQSHKMFDCRRAWTAGGRTNPRVVSDLAQPAGGHGEKHSLLSGGLSR